MGFYGASKNSEQLIKKALDNKVDFGANYVNGKSLLQHLVASGNQELINLVVNSKDQDIVSTLFTAISQNDIRSLEAILSIKSNLATVLHDGYSFLHFATSLNKLEAVKKIVSCNQECVDLLTNNSESALGIALRKDYVDITKALIPFVNFRNELENLDSRGNLDLLERFDNADIDLNDEMRYMIECIVSNRGIVGSDIYQEEIDFLGNSISYEI